jgi:hypothetical protein
VCGAVRDEEFRELFSQGSFLSEGLSVGSRGGVESGGGYVLGEAAAF